jgi:replicative DNA helicase
MTATLNGPAEAAPQAESTPLWDVGAERCVLGAMMLDKSVIGEVQQRIPNSDAFYHPGHSTVFDAICALHSAGKPADVFSVLAHLAEAGTLAKVGGGPYLHTLIEQVPFGAHGPYYAGIVADRATLRALDEAAARIRRMIREGGAGNSADMVERARVMVADLAGRVASTDGPVRWRDLIEAGMDNLETLEASKDEPAGIPTGFPELDEAIHGLQTGRVYVVAGESGSGKSTLTADFVRSVSFRHNTASLVFNMEMTANELFNRFVCAHASVDHDRVASGTMTDQDWTKIARMCGETENAPLWIDDTPDLSAADIRVRAHRWKQQHDIKIVVVDLIGLVKPTGGQTREQQVSAISRSLKVLAKELDVAVIVVAQINRGPQQRSDKRPNIHDLRESAGIGHDADAVILVYRPEKHDKTKRRGEADLIIAKNRFGPEKDVVVCAQMHLSRFVSMAIPT